MNSRKPTIFQELYVPETDRGEAKAMKTISIRPGPIALVVLLLLLAFTLELVLSGSAAAEPYPREDHYGLQKHKRQYSQFRRDDYEDYSKDRRRRYDHYDDHYRPSLSQLDRTPDPYVSLERVVTTRAEYDDRKESARVEKHGEGHFDKRAKKGIDVIDGGKGYY